MNNLYFIHAYFFSQMHGLSGSMPPSFLQHVDNIYFKTLHVDQFYK